MTDYNVPDDFMNLSNEIYEPLYQLLHADRGEIRSQEEAKAGIHGLMGFFHQHDRNNLDSMGIDGWMDNIENPDHDAVRRVRIEDIIYDLRNIIDQHEIYHDEPVTAQSITNMLVRMFGTRAEGIRKSKKSKSKKSKSKKSKSKKSKSNKSKSNKSKSNKSKSKKNKPNRKKKKTKRKR